MSKYFKIVALPHLFWLAAILAVLFLLADPGDIQAASNWQYFKLITISKDNVSGPVDLLSFPVLISVTDPDLRTATYGGKVKHASGYDIIFQDAAGNKLDFEIERYVASTGELITWVRIPVLYTNQDTTLYLYYGNDSIISSQENKTGVWDSGYKLILHMHDSTNEATDSTANYDGKAVGRVTFGATGKIGKAVSIGNGNYYDAGYLDLGRRLDITSLPFTLSAWISPINFNNYGTIFAKRDTYYITDMRFDFDYDVGSYGQPGSLLLQSGFRYEGGSEFTSNYTLPAATWTYVTLVSRTGGTDLYINGRLQESWGAFRLGTDSNAMVRIGNVPDSLGPDQYYGYIDEERLSAVIRTPDWIATEYLNQNNPPGFIIFGPPVSNGAPTVTDVAINEPDYCSVGPGGLVSWTYQDPENDSQAFYQVQVFTQGGALAYDSGQISSGNTTAVVPQGILQFNTTYWVQVKVWQIGDGLSSNWVSQTVCNGPGCAGNRRTWTTPRHAYPLVNFSWVPAKPLVNQSVTFTDGSTFYDGGGTRIWNWTAPNASPPSGNSAIYNTKYLFTGIYNVTDTVTDKDGYSCALSQPITVQKSIPIWKEIIVSLGLNKVFLALGLSF